MKSHIDELRSKRIHIPAGADEQRHDDLDLVYYCYLNSSDQPCAICFEGRKLKSSFNFRFKNEDRRKAYIDKWTEDRQKEVDYKSQLQKERAEFMTSLTVGSIVSTSWGYEQTNVEFYEITKVKTAKKVCLREIQKKLTNAPGSSPMAGKVIPVPGAYLADDNEFEKMVSIGNRIKISSCQSATPWDGKPQYCSWYD
jgi:hypothetical protein